MQAQHKCGIPNVALLLARKRKAEEKLTAAQEAVASAAEAAAAAAEAVVRFCLFFSVDRERERAVRSGVV